MTSDALTIVWFRQDLRIADNPALRAAADRGRLLPIYILDDVNAGAWAPGAASRAWLHHSLADLQQSLDGKLRYFVGDAESLLDRLVEDLPVEAVYWNRCYEPWRSERDARIKKKLAAAAIDCESFNASLLWEPWTIHKQDGTPYRVFTPFYQKGCLQAPSPRTPLAPPQRMEYFDAEVTGSVSLDSMELLPPRDWHRDMLSHWRIGEDSAHQRLEEFCSGPIVDYRQGRDYPALESTSRLSPHLHFGEISPQQAWYRAEQATLHSERDGPAHFMRELGWREFSYHLLFHFPRLPDTNFNPKFDQFSWLENRDGLVAWQRGQTGFPIVDAGMRELWQTGYMHNRVRMIVASFLIKNQLMHWTEGEHWFWDCLVDADLASNSASWQWVAGSGADAAPYFRIFNPVLQSEKFDPKTEYLLRYCPELAELPPKYRHRPWEASEAILLEAGIELGVDYPRPMLDLKVTRERALERFKALA